MTTLNLISRGVDRAPDVDAHVLGVRAFVDGEYFQYFTMAVSGLDQLPYLEPDSKEEVPSRFWRAVARVAVEAIEVAVRSAEAQEHLPLSVPTDAYDLPVDMFRVRELMESSVFLPDPSDGRELGPIEL